MFTFTTTCYVKMKITTVNGGNRMKNIFHIEDDVDIAKSVKIYV